jgi:hypothetical protein
MNQDDMHWGVARITVILVALLGVLLITSNKFDFNEIMTLVVVFLAAAGLEAAARKFGQ